MKQQGNYGPVPGSITTIVQTRHYGREYDLADIPICPKCGGFTVLAGKPGEPVEDMVWECQQCWYPVQNATPEDHETVRQYLKKDLLSAAETLVVGELPRAPEGEDDPEFMGLGGVPLHEDDLKALIRAHPKPQVFTWGHGKADDSWFLLREDYERIFG